MRDPSDDEEAERLVANGFANKIRNTLGKIPFTEQAVAAYFCATDPATPAHVKATIIGALAYFIIPIDGVPDFILGLGYTDDAAVFWVAYRMISTHISERHFAKAKEFLSPVTGPD